MSDPQVLDCEEVLRVILSYLDGELPTADHDRVEMHLERCRSCLSRAEFERRLKDHLADLACAPVSTEFEERIRTMISQFAHPGSGEGHQAVPET